MNERQNYRNSIVGASLAVVWCLTFLEASFLLAQNPRIQPTGNSSAARSVAISTLAGDTQWETPVYQIDSLRPGPTVMIAGGAHGNEPAGVQAAQQTLLWPITRGRLVVIPCVNRPVYQARTRYLPGVPSSRRDLNRCFPTPQQSAPSGSLATALWELTVSTAPDWVLDLHEGFEFHISHQPAKGKKKSVGSSVIYRQSPDNEAMVRQMLQRVNATVANPDRRFAALGRGPLTGSWVRACLDQLNIPGMIIETTIKDQSLSLRARQHRMLVGQVLLDLQMIDLDPVDLLVDPQSEAIAVGVFDGPGAATEGVRRLLDVIDAQPDMLAIPLGPEDVQPQILQSLDTLVFPGGSGSKQAHALGPDGRTAVRRFVGEGGGYVGICAGAYLCSAHYDWSLKIIDTAVFTGARDIPGVGRKQMWYRGGATSVEMELTPAGLALYQGLPADLKVRYHNGPIVSPANDPLLPDYEILAVFRSENGLYPPQVGTMIGTPAVVRAHFESGRVVSISPHPESTTELLSMVTHSIRWVARNLSPSLEPVEGGINESSKNSLGSPASETAEVRR